jgi:hypothetical protein
MRGGIPTEVAELKGLRYLYLNENKLTGQVPPELGDLPELRHL